MTCKHVGGAIICSGGATIKLGTWLFEMHPYCGPMRLNKDMSGSKADFPKQFWPIFKRWQNAGEKVDENGNGIIDQVYGRPRRDEMSKYIDIVFDGPPSHESGRFVEVEDCDGKSIKYGEWVDRKDGFWALRIVEPGEISEVKAVYVAWGNTDNTEGRGQSYPLAVCDSETTAKRLGQKKGVQGMDCHVSEEGAFKINGTWQTAARIHQPSDEDKKNDKRRLDKRWALKKASDAGMTDTDIKALLDSIDID